MSVADSFLPAGETWRRVVEKLERQLLADRSRAVPLASFLRLFARRLTGTIAHV
jgi:hypothetical protein